MKETGLKRIAFQASRLGMAAVFAYFVFRILESGAMRALFSGRHVRRWVHPGTDPIEFWLGVALLAAASAACLLSFLRHLDRRGWGY